MTKSIVMMMISLALTFAVFATGCTSTPGVVRTAGQNALVSITAGDVAIDGGFARSLYVVDKEARLCWFLIALHTSPADCCALRRVSAVRPSVSWEDDASCNARGVPPTATPTTSAATPPTPTKAP